MLTCSAFYEVDPIGIEPTTSTLPVRQHAKVSRDENRDDIQPVALVPPNVPPSEPRLRELLAIWMNLDDRDRNRLLSVIRAIFLTDEGKNDALLSGFPEQITVLLGHKEACGLANQMDLILILIVVLLILKHVPKK